MRVIVTQIQRHSQTLSDTEAENIEQNIMEVKEIKKKKKIKLYPPKPQKGWKRNNLEIFVAIFNKLKKKLL